MSTSCRRDFLASIGALASACSLSSRFALCQEPKPVAWPIAIFEKAFEGLNYDELADAVEQTGADGIEATVRKGGHITPELAAEET